MTRTLFIVFLSCIGLYPAGAWDADSLILRGNEYYVNNDFEEAIEDHSLNLIDTAISLIEKIVR